MTLLSDTYYLPRTSRYASPLAGNDRQPLPYGDLTDGSSGVWILPCIDTVNHVYCFSASPVLTVAEGNSISIYADDVLVDPADYTFNASNDYEGNGDIATITFTVDKANSIVSARGKGKASAGVLIENIIDILDEFLTAENDFTSALYEPTAKARAREVFSGQGYKAAGVLVEDDVIWNIVNRMMSSFLGSAFFNGYGQLFLNIDTGVVSGSGQPDIIPQRETVLQNAKQRLINLINRCPANYAYNYVAGEFKRQTNDSDHADAISISIHGTREPNTPYQFYWCRDLGSIQAMQDIIVGKFKDPLYEIEIDDITLKRMGVDVGDIVIHSEDGLYEKSGDPLINQLWLINSVRPDFQKGKIRFRALQTNYYRTEAYLLDGSWLFDGSKKLGADRDLTTY